jgi:hypothetical protein
MPQISHKRELLSSGHTLQFGGEFVGENADFMAFFRRLTGLDFWRLIASVNPCHYLFAAISTALAVNHKLHPAH